MQMHPVKKARLSAGLNYRELAEQSDLSIPTLVRIESGEQVSDLSMYIRSWPSTQSGKRPTWRSSRPVRTCATTAASLMRSLAPVGFARPESTSLRAPRYWRLCGFSEDSKGRLEDVLYGEYSNLSEGG